MDPQRYGYSPQSRPTDRYRQAPSSEGQIRVGIDHRDAGRGRIHVGMEKSQDAPKVYGRPSNLPKPRTAAQAAYHAESASSTSSTSSSKASFGFRKASAQAAMPVDQQRQEAQISQARLKRMPAFGQPTQRDDRRISPPKPDEPQWPLPVDEAAETLSQPPAAGQRIPELDRYPHYLDPFADGWLYGTGQNQPMQSSQSSYSQYSSGYSAHSASPSTRFSESPRLGAYSRDTTPTSSPGLLPPFQTKPLLRQESPKFSRPPVTKRRMGSGSEDAGALSTVRESLTSSSSNSTVKDSAKESEEKEKNKKKKKRLSPMPPSPPPRKSSVKFRSNPHSPETSPVKCTRGLAAATMTSGASPRIGSEETSPQQRIASPQTSLNVPSRVGFPPRRPSRDGTPDLSSIAGPASIVHSNLTNAPASIESRPTTSRLPARKGAPPLPALGIPRKATPAPAPAGLGFQLPDPRSAGSTGSGLRTPSPSTANSATSKHRFGLFSRREKAVAGDAAPAEKKTARKGPAAGTGHEGYGRYALGGRGRSNTLSSRERTLSNVSTTSQESFGSSMTASTDPFFSQRSSPVVIAGGGKVVENYNNSSSIELIRIESNQSQRPPVRPSFESKTSQSSSRSNLGSTLLPPFARNNPAASSTSLASKVSDSSDAHRWSPKKNLVGRRSLLRLNKKDLLGLQPPKPLAVLDPRESGVSSQSSLYDGAGNETLSSISAPNKLTKRPTSPNKKWHFFQRKPKLPKLQPVEPVTDATKNPLTYFAIDSDEEKSKITIEDLKDIMREAEVPEFHDIEIGYGKQEELQRPPMRPRAGSKGSFTLFPKIEEPKMEAEPQSAIEQGIPMMWNNADRASPRMRLAQVGRIPKVVTSHPPTQATIISSPEMSDRSFSRPFRLSVAREPVQPPTPNDPSSVALGPSPQKSPAMLQEEKPFLAFSPRKTSEAGTTSSSSGILSSFEGTTAVVPNPEESWNDDEVWDEEFDDLIRTPSIESPLAQVNLRVGSMTVSKWLTFGHVLFSPARESLNDPQPSKHHSILVIDGLGNDDWSFYAAETYPDATFYNLTTSSQQPNTNRMSMSTTAIPARPPNHRQVQHLSLSNKFPFIPNTFTIVVLRFLAASSESLMRHVVGEAKRVLKPGGFLEMSVLDLDMRDMGPKTRRAVRDLKINVSLGNPDISLASAADTMLRLVNKRGFTNIKSCNVGVPVATVVTNNSAAGTPMGGESDTKERKELKKEVSLADLMKDPDPAGDAGITKMVAKVGRWWFKQCYEKEREKSIFDDKKVLAECEKWETSFKLCVAHAQKGEAQRRRTASV